MEWIDLVFGGFGGIIASGVANFIFKESIKAKLRKEVEIDIAKFKNELDTKKEILKNDLQIGAYKAQLMHNNVNLIYPDLIAKLEIAVGSVSGLQGVRFSVDLNKMSEEDIISFIGSKNISASIQKEILDKYRADKKVGIKMIRDLLRDIEIDEACKLCMEARNFRILKSIYCSEEVLTEFDNCYQALWGAWVDLDVGRMDRETWRRGSDSIRKDVPVKLEKVTKAIRLELRADKADVN